LTDNGDVWAWGYGGRSSPFGCSWLSVHNPLGTGPSGSSSTPVKVDIKNVTQISAGHDFSVAVAGGRVFGWGQGLSNLNDDPSSLPVELGYVNQIIDTKKTSIKKIASTDDFAMFLYGNGRLYAVGKNVGGATATRHNAKVITDNVLRQLTKINDHPFHG
jgi:alpha-tubulin suppressor-like RCC1 family protein